MVNTDQVLEEVDSVGFGAGLQVDEFAFSKTKAGTQSRLGAEHAAARTASAHAMTSTQLQKQQTTHSCDI